LPGPTINVSKEPWDVNAILVHGWQEVSKIDKNLSNPEFSVGYLLGVCTLWANIWALSLHLPDEHLN